MTTRIHTQTEPSFEKITQTFIHEFLSENSALSQCPAVRELTAGGLENPEQNAARSVVPEKGRSLEEVIRELKNEIFTYGYETSHPRFFGFVPSTASRLSWLGDIMTSAYNRHAGSLANFPRGCQTENELIRWLCDSAGFPKTAGGLFVSGGSMANMTALASARDALLSEPDWSRGVAYVSEQTHSSVAKSLHLIGISTDRIRCLPTDRNFRMNTALLEAAIQKDLDRGLLPFTVIASAGTTNTGSVDPLSEIAAICRRYHLWMHVDGSFGASVLLSGRHRDLLSGIELADSLSWDAHKWLFQTYGCGMVLVRDRKNLANSFHAHPEYLKDLELEEEYLNPWNLGPELTRPARGLKLWLTLQVMGRDAIAASIDHGFDLAEYAEQLLARIPEAEILSPAQMAVINFRFSPKELSEEEKDSLNLQISKQIVSSGYAGVFTTELNGKKVLRLCFIHPETTKEDIRNTLGLLEKYCRRLLKKTLRDEIPA